MDGTKTSLVKLHLVGGEDFLFPSNSFLLLFLSTFSFFFTISKDLIQLF